MFLRDTNENTGMHSHPHMSVTLDSRKTRQLLGVKFREKARELWKELLVLSSWGQQT